MLTMLRTQVEHLRFYVSKFKEQKFKNHLISLKKEQKKPTKIISNQKDMKCNQRESKYY